MARHLLLDGTAVEVRPIAPADADALVQFHEQLSPESQRLRFFGTHPHLSPSEVARFSTVDHRQREAFVAVNDDEIIGVARYDRERDDGAEIAFVTRDDHQGTGVATVLFHELAMAAGRNGIRVFVAETLLENRKMLTFFANTGLVKSRAYAGGTVRLTMPLPDPHT